MNQAHIEPPKEVFKEAELSRFTTEELLAEISRREESGFIHQLNVATARVELSFNHYQHNVDLTVYPFYCSDCEVGIDGR